MLRQHPGIYIPAQKELFYFNRRFFESPELPNYNARQPLSWYLAFFVPGKEDQIKGEASPAYIWDEEAPQRIADFNRNLKLVAVLRNPVDRAFSQYLYLIQRGLFSKITFEEAIQRRSDLLSRGLYAQQLQRFFKLFPAGQIHVAFYDDLQEDNRKFLAELQAFLGVTEMYPANIDESSNVTGVPRLALLNRAISWVRYPLRKYNPPGLMQLLRKSGIAQLQERIRLANTRPFEVKPDIAPQTRLKLIAYFKEDVERLQTMTGRDLSAWLKGE